MSQACPILQVRRWALSNLSTSIRRLCAVIAILTAFFIVPLGHASPISFTLAPSTITASPGDTVTFMGSITNTSGVSLEFSDLFFNFGGYDPNGISDITQLLGNTNFTLPNNTFSPIVDLFTVTVTLAASGSYSFDTVLEDINNDLSDPVTATVKVGGVAPTPEAGTMLLCLTGTAALFVGTHLSRRRPAAKPLRSES